MTQPHTLERIKSGAKPFDFPGVQIRVVADVKTKKVHMFNIGVFLKFIAIKPA